KQGRETVKFEAAKALLCSAPVLPMPTPPRDHIVWSLLTFLYCNPCCLGLAAVIYSIKARDRKMVGDLEGAQRHGSTAYSLNATALMILMVIGVVDIIKTEKREVESTYTQILH
uniref:Uncharacterized protein n=1 Tax=Mastacembelus armatus TaxID=205130 RepID=A0A3Q3NBY9_9TELE